MYIIASSSKLLLFVSLALVICSIIMKVVWLLVEVNSHFTCSFLSGYSWLFVAETDFKFCICRSNILNGAFVTGDEVNNVTFLVSHWTCHFCFGAEEWFYLLHVVLAEVIFFIFETSFLDIWNILSWSCFPVGSEKKCDIVVFRKEMRMQIFHQTLMIALSVKLDRKYFNCNSSIFNHIYIYIPTLPSEV